MVSRSKRKFADYVQYYKPNIPITIIEAKDNNHSVGDGMQQALEYAATNGDGFAFHDQTGISPKMESKLELDGLPSPETLWNIYREWKNLFPAVEEVVFQDYFDNGSDSNPRYYRRNAINVATVAIVKGQDRVPLQLPLTAPNEFVGQIYFARLGAP